MRYTPKEKVSLPCEYTSNDHEGQVSKTNRAFGFPLISPFEKKRVERREKLIPRGTCLMIPWSAIGSFHPAGITPQSLLPREKRFKGATFHFPFAKKMKESHESSPAKRKPMLTRCACENCT
jgi:hypothetical protein